MGSCAPDSMIGFGTHLGPAPPCPCCAPIRRWSTGGSAPPSSTSASPERGPGLRGPGRCRRAGRRRVRPGLQRLYDAPYTVTPRINHVGMRVAGPVPRRSVSGEVLSRGVPVGAIEAPTGDELLVLMRGRGSRRVSGARGRHLARPGRRGAAQTRAGDPLPPDDRLRRHRRVPGAAAAAGPCRAACAHGVRGARVTTVPP
ncbi:hypothetical protein NKH77_08090 [Streptomyces sp. M19]